MISAVDTSILSAVLSDQPGTQVADSLLTEARDRGGVVICGIVYSELFAHPLMTGEIIEDFLQRTGLEVDYRLDKTVWKEAGIRFKKYAERRRRARQEWPRRLLADFVIGAHSLLHADRLITFNGADFRRDFPELLIAPELA